MPSRIVRTLAVLWFAVSGTVELASEPPVPAVAPELAAHEAQWDPARIEQVTDRVRMAIGFGFSNIVFIEGETSTIVVDWGLFTNNTAEALAAYRKVSEKPIGTLVLTHPHEDHFAGVGGLFPDGIPEGIAIIGPKHNRFKDGQRVSVAPDFPRTTYRGMVLQFGTPLPKGQPVLQGSVLVESLGQAP